MKLPKYRVMKKTGSLQAVYELFNLPFSLFVAYALAEITDNLQTESAGNAVMQCLGLILIWFVYGICMSGFQHLLLSVRIREQLQVREEVFRGILCSRRKTVEISAGGILENMSNDIDRVTDHYGRKLPVACLTMLSSLLYLTISVFLSPVAALCMLLLALLQVIPHVLVKKVFMKNYLDCRDIEAEITNVFIAGYQGAEELKVYGALPWLNKILYRKHREYEKIGMKSEMSVTGQNMSSSLVEQLVKYGYFAVSGLLFSMRKLSASEVAAMVVLANAFFPGINTLFRIIPEFGVDRVAWQRLAPWAERQGNQEKTPVPDALAGNALLLHIEGLQQCYGDKIIFRNFSADIPLVSRVAFCGKNGSGKTTLLRILAGQATGAQGTIRSDQGYWETLTAGGGIAYVPQECPGVNFCARDLIGKGRERFEKLAAEFGLEEEFLDAPLRNLSGGQKKKIYLAAAFAMDVPLIVLDEPDNELDELGKRVLKEQMTAYPGGIFYVSHEKDFLNLAQMKINLNETGVSKK